MTMKYVVALCVAVVSIGCGPDPDDDDIGEAGTAVCKQGGRDFVACGESGVCYNGACCDGCWRVACPAGKCALVCTSRIECE